MPVAWFEQFEGDEALFKVVPIWELWIVKDGKRVRMIGFSRTAPDPPWL